MKQPVKTTDTAKAAQSQSTETAEHPELHKNSDEKATPKTQPISRFLEATCDCV